MRVVIVLEMFKRDSYRLVGYSRVITNGHVYQDDLHRLVSWLESDIG